MQKKSHFLYYLFIVVSESLKKHGVVGGEIKKPVAKVPAFSISLLFDRLNGYQWRYVKHFRWGACGRTAGRF